MKLGLCVVRSGFAARCEIRLRGKRESGHEIRPCVVRSGFAARCEAGLCPAGRLLNMSGAMPLVRALPWNEAEGPNPGAQPKNFLLRLPAGHSPASHQAAKPERTTRQLRLC